MVARFSLTRREVFLLLLGAFVVHLLPFQLPARQQIVVETVCEHPSDQQHSGDKLIYQTQTTTIIQPTTTTVISQPTPTTTSLDKVTEFPETSILSHFPGWTLFENVYISNDTFFIVTDQSSSDLPPISAMISVPLEATSAAENVAARMPTKHSLQFITAAEARGKWGGDLEHGGKNRVWTVTGNTVFINEPGQFLRHYYHLCAELVMGIQAMLLGAVTPSVTDGSRDFHFEPIHNVDAPAPPPVDRFIFARTNADGWRDDPDFNSYFMRAAFPASTIEERESWEDRVLITTSGDRAWHFPRLLLTDRSAAYRSELCGLKTQRIAAEPFEGFRAQGRILGLRVGGWWAPVREAVLRFAGAPPMEAVVIEDVNSLATPSKIVITYLSRQATPRRHLTPEGHLGLVDALEKLVARKGSNWELNVVVAEHLSKDEQIKLAARTTILLGVYGNGLTHLLMMRPNRFSTVIEIFYPSGFARDYQWPTHALGMRHFAVWNDTWLTDGIGDGIPSANYPEGFQGDSIPVHGPTVADLIEDRVEGHIEGI